MKTNILIIVIVFVIFVTGCVVTSFHPLYTQKDLVFDESLLGTWKEGDSEWRIERFYYSGNTFLEKFGEEIRNDSDKVPHKSYLVHYTESEYDKNTGRYEVDSVQLHVHMLKLGNNYYLDFYGQDLFLKDNFFIATNLVNVHTFAKVNIADSVTISWFNSDWLKDLIDQNKIKIKHERTDDLILLTASTKELQKFIIKYGDSEDAFDEDLQSVLHRNN